jgi:hypothetical protein
MGRSKKYKGQLMFVFKEKFLFYIVLLNLTIPNVMASQEDHIRLCSGSLNAFSQEIKANKPNLSSEYVTGHLGWLSIINNSEISSTVGKLEDITSCLRVNGVKSSDIDILIKAFYGLLPENPYDDIGSCMAYYHAASNEIDVTFGTQRSFKIGSVIGFKIGTVISSINYLYKLERNSYDDISLLAQKKLSELNRLEHEDKVITLNSYGQLCSWYNIPVNSILEGAVAGGQ